MVCSKPQFLSDIEAFNVFHSSACVLPPLRGRGFDSRIGTFFSLLFFCLIFSLSFSFMLALPFQCSSIFLVIVVKTCMLHKLYSGSFNVPLPQELQNIVASLVPPMPPPPRFLRLYACNNVTMQSHFFFA